MKKTDAVRRLAVLSLLIAVGVIISPILRVEGMCPMAHLINIICSVLLGPWYSLLCAALIGIIRMLIMGIPPLALTGAIFGAFLSGLFYRMSKGRIARRMGLPASVLKHAEGFLSSDHRQLEEVLEKLDRDQRKLAANGVLAKMQRSLGAVSYRDQSSILSDSLTVAALGAILWVMLKLAAAVFALTSPVWNVLANVVPAAAAAAGLIYYMVRKGRDTDAEAQ